MERQNLHMQHNIEALSLFCLEYPAYVWGYLCCSRRMFFYLHASAVFIVQDSCEVTYYIAYTCHIDSSEMLKKFYVGVRIDCYFVPFEPNLNSVVIV